VLDGNNMVARRQQLGEEKHRHVLVGIHPERRARPTAQANSPALERVFAAIGSCSTEKPRPNLGPVAGSVSGRNAEPFTYT
jgi:hypothetical protein